LCEKLLESLVFSGWLVKVAFFVAQNLNYSIAFILDGGSNKHVITRCFSKKIKDFYTLPMNFLFLTLLNIFFKTNPSPTKIPRSTPFGRAKTRGATNT
jgi:hypothetical protein